MRAWQKALTRLDGKPFEQQVVGVNALINAARWVSDDDNYGTSDHWATPGQFLARGGDCEDYAIAKLVSLARLGVSTDRMRVLVVHDQVRDLVHAVLAIEADGSPLLLDNLNPDVVTADLAPQYRPLYSVNFDHLWLHDTLP
jgi:predicted transglutaminase-like cysteine proteinase